MLPDLVSLLGTKESKLSKLLSEKTFRFQIRGLKILVSPVQVWFLAFLMFAQKVLSTKGVSFS
jgi:hypothetical protein